MGEPIWGNCERCGHYLTEQEYGTCVSCDEEEKQALWEQEACICWATDFSGKSICGVPCPVHAPREKT